MIVEEVQAFGGDILKFAGDALIVEWQAVSCDDLNDNENSPGSSSRQLEKQFQSTHQLKPEDAVRTAATCAARIVEKCSNYQVYQDLHDPPVSVSCAFSEDCGVAANSAKTNTASTKVYINGRKSIATLNLHCGIGFGCVTGLHVGDTTKREYLLLGDPIKQAADAIALGRGGEVVASPQVQQLLNLTKGKLGNDLASKEGIKGNDVASPIIFSANNNGVKESIFASNHEQRTEHEPLSGADLSRPSKTKETQHDCFSHLHLLETWKFTSLLRLQHRMSLYVHPLVVTGELFTTIYRNHEYKRRNSNESIHSTTDLQLIQSEAEIRDVFTLFIQPLVSVDIPNKHGGDSAQNQDVLILLNRIMVITNRELARFSGHLRQFIVVRASAFVLTNNGFCSFGQEKSKFLLIHFLLCRFSSQHNCRTTRDLSLLVSTEGCETVKRDFLVTQPFLHVIIIQTIQLISACADQHFLRWSKSVPCHSRQVFNQC